MDVPYDKLLPALNRLLPDHVLDALGDATRFIRRLRQISASTFVWSVVLSRFGQGSPGFEQARQWFCRLSGGHVWPRPFQMRFKSDAAVRLFERAFEHRAGAWIALGSRHIMLPRRSRCSQSRGVTRIGEGDRFGGARAG